MISSLALLSVVVFPGGSASDLAAAIFKANRKPIFIAQGIMAKLGPSQFEANNIDEISKAIRKTSAIRMSPGSDLVFSDSILPVASVPNVHYPPPTPAPAFKAISGLALRNGFVTWRTLNNERFDLASLSAMSFSKPVRVHPLLTRYAIALYAERVPERDFLRLAAIAAGGKLVETSDAYKLELNPQELKVRLINLFKLLEDEEVRSGRDSGTRLVALKMMERAFNEATPSTLATAFAGTGSSATFDLAAGSNGHTSMLKLISDYNVAAGYPLQNGVLKTPSGSVSLNLEGNFGITIASDFHIKVGVPVLDQDGKPGALQLALSPDGG